MTVNEIKTDLFTWFSNHDSFSMEENFDELYVLCPKNEKPFKKALVEKALDDYVEAKFATRVEFKNDKKNQKVWVLQKPLNQHSQIVELNFPTLSVLIEIVNKYCDEMKVPESRVDPLNVQEKDVMSLCLIVGQMMGAAANG